MKRADAWRRPLVSAAFLAMSAMVVFGSWAMGSDSVERDVPYVPTPMDVVDRMLDMAEVGPDDIVYDLGCGDGRIVISAVSERGASRGVGIDIDPERIEESRRNAEAAGIEGRVEFIEQDLFKSDISEATVVALYLLPTVNVRLRPKLLDDLEPGTRVVSHAFDMKKWAPDAYDNIDGREVFFWVIPANMTGAWEWTEGDGEFLMEVDQEYQRVIGNVSGEGATVQAVDPVLRGPRVEFSVERVVGGRDETVRYQGTVEGDTIRGRMVRGDGQAMPWTATRQEGTRTPLEEAAEGAVE